MDHTDENLVDEAPAVHVGVNRTASDMTADEWERLTPEQREALEKGDEGMLPVDSRSPLYDEPASANFVHGLDPRVVSGEIEATDTAATASATPAGAFNVLAGEVPAAPVEYEGGNDPAEHLALDGDEVPLDENLDESV